MADPTFYTYESPLKGYENREPLSEDRNADGKSYKNPETGKLSEAYERFPDPINNGERGGFDVHIYYYQENAEQKQYAYELWKRIRYEFPELRIYRVMDKPIGPHTLAMFEVNLFNPHQFGAFISWLVINRGPLSALVHPNTGDDERDHTQRATWMGREIPVDMTLFRRKKQKQAQNL